MGNTTGNVEQRARRADTTGYRHRRWASLRLTLVGAVTASLLASVPAARPAAALPGLASIVGTVWLDADADTTRNTAEGGVSAVAVRLTTPGLDGQLGTADDAAHPSAATTDSTGAYRFDNLLPGTYRVAADLSTAPAGTVASGPAYRDVALSVGQELSGQDLALRYDGALGDLVWLDADGDGIHQGGEAGLGGVVVSLLRPGADNVLGTADDEAAGGTTSGSDGAWRFDNLAPGSYRVSFDAASAPVGTAPTTPVTTDATLDPHQARLDVDAGFRFTGAIGDLVYLDTDADGNRGAGEAGLAGVVVHLLAVGADGAFATADDVAFPARTTDAAGAYGFANLAPGTYRVSVDEATGPLGSSVSGAANPTQVTLEPHQVEASVDLGFRYTASIGDRVWLDRDADGVADPDDPGLGGVAVRLWGAGGDGVLGTADDEDRGSRTTTADGGYDFANLAPGHYRVVADPASSPAGSAAVTATSHDVALAPHQAYDDADFGFRWTGSIGDEVFVDVDADGGRDAGDAGVPGVRVRLAAAGPDGVAGSADDEHLGEMTTSAAGSYSFANLAPGRYVVALDESSGPAGTAASGPGATRVVQLDAHQADTGVDFGLRFTGSVGDRVWLDADGDGTVGPGEGGVAGAGVRLYDLGGDGEWATADDVDLGTRVSDGTGIYEFANLAPGRYRVAVDPASAPDGTVATTAAERSVDLAAHEHFGGADFGFRYDGAIGDEVWLDADADGVRQAGETGLAGIAVALWHAGPDGVPGTGDDQPAGAAVTTADGTYRIGNLPAGTYRVLVDSSSAPAGTSPTTATGFDVVLAAHAHHLDADAGFRWTAGLGDLVFVDHDGDGVVDPGEPGQGGVRVALTWAGPDGALSTPDDASFGERLTTAEGAYSFANLPPGSFRLDVHEATLPAGSRVSGGNPVLVSLAPHQVDHGVDVGLRYTATIGDAVWHDANGDGLHNAGESGIAGVVVRLAHAGPDGELGTADDVEAASTSSDVGGGYDFGGLAPGWYRVAVDAASAPAGMVVASRTSFDIELSPHEDADLADFGLRFDGSIGGLVWSDGDGDGLRQEGEAMSSDVSVSLQFAGGDGQLGTDDDESHGTVTSAADGRFHFAHLQPGLYQITAAAGAAGTAFTTSDVRTVTLAPHGADDSAEFGLRFTGSVGDVVFGDHNGDGVHDPGEPGMPGVRVLLTGAGADGSLDTADDLSSEMISETAGAYQFANLAPGRYRVEVDESSVSQLLRRATGPTARQVDLAEHEQNVDADFGFARAEWSTLALNPGAVTTVAGSGIDATVDGTGTAASLRAVGGVAVLGTNVYVGTQGAIRRVDTTTAGVTTLAGHPTLTGCVASADPSAVRFGTVNDMASDGTYLFALSTCPGGGGGWSWLTRTTLATGATSNISTLRAERIAFGPDGQLYLSGTTSSTAYLYRMNPLTGSLSTAATTGPVNGFSASGGPVAADAYGVWWVLSAGGANRLDRIDIATGVRTTAVSSGMGMQALASAGDYLYNSAGATLNRYTKADGTWLVAAGSGGFAFADGTGFDAWFDRIVGLASDGTRVWIADSNNRRLRAAVPAPPLPSAQANGVTVTLSANPAAVTTVAGNGLDANIDAEGASASFRAMGGSVVVGGYAYVGTQGAIRRVDTATGAVTTLAGHATLTGCVTGTDPGAVRFGVFSDLTTDSTYIYSLSVCPNDPNAYGRILRTSIATGATSSVAAIAQARHLVFGADGMLYVSANWSRDTYLYRLDPAKGTWAAVASSYSTPDHNAVGGPVAADANGVWWVVSVAGSSRLDRIETATGARTTVVASGMGMQALASAGDYLYNSAGRTLTRYAKADGTWVVAAGSGGAGVADGTGADAWFDRIVGLASDGNRIWIADGDNNRRLRAAVPAPPLPSAQADGVNVTLSANPAAVTTVAGNGLDANIDAEGASASFRAMGGAVVIGGYAYVGTQGAIRRVDTATGAVTTLAGHATLTGCVTSTDASAVRFGTFLDLTTDGTFLYSMSVCPSDPNAYGRIHRTSIATGATSGVAAIAQARNLAFGPDGMLYVAATYGSTAYLYRVDPAKGTWTTVISSPPPSGSSSVAGPVAADATSVWWALSVGGTTRLDRIEVATGSRNTVATGGIGMQALASAGDFLYNSTGSTLIRFAKATGVSMPLAGGPVGYADGTGTSARLASVNGIASDGQWLWLTDSGNRSLRVASPHAVLIAGSQNFGIDGYAGIDDDVNPALGNYVRSDEEASVASVGPELSVERTYNSRDSRIGPFGIGWSFELGMRAERLAGGSVAVIFPDGRREVHKLQPSGAYLPPPGYYSRLTPNAFGGFDLRTKDATTYVFGQSGLLGDLYDENGRHLSFNYDAAGQLSTVADAASGRALHFAWSAGHVTEVSTDPVAAHGGPLTWRYVYDGDRLTKVCDPRDNDPAAGSCLVYTWADNRISKVTRPKGNTEVEIGYRVDGRVDWKRNGVANLTDYEYPAVGRTTVKDGRNNTTTKEYDGANRLVRQTDPAGKATSYEYTAGNRTRVTDANDNTSSMTYDGRGNLVSVTDGEGRTSYSAYDAEDNRVFASDGRSADSDDATYATVYEYDARGNRTRERTPATADFPAGVSKRWEYSNGSEAAWGGGQVPPGLVLAEIDERGKTTTHRYDPAGNLRQSIDPVGLRREFTYDELGRKTTETVYSDAFPAGLTTTFTWTALSAPATVTAPRTTASAGGSDHQVRTTTAYDANANKAEVRVEDLVGGDAPRVATYGYDDADREFRVTDPEGGQMTRAFDAAGNVVRVTDAEGRVTETAYDNRNLPVTVTALAVVDDPTLPSVPRDVVVARYGYDAAGRRTSEIDALGRERTTTYDRADRPTKVVAVGFVTRTGATRDVVMAEKTYDAAGNVTREVSGATLRADHTYDPAGRRTRTVVDPDGVNRIEDYAYDEAGAVVRRRLSGGGRVEETRSAYDDGGRLVSTTVENGALDAVATFAYDQRGSLVAEVDPRGFTTDHAYDEAGRRVRTTAPPVAVDEEGTSRSERPVTEAGHDTFGQPTRSRDARGNLTVTTFDRLGRRVRVDHPAYTPAEGGGPVSAFEAFAYDRVGNLVARTDRRGALTEFVFDSRNRAVRQLDPAAVAGGPRGVVITTYDDAGNRTAAIDQAGARTEWTYDALNRARSATAVVRQPTGDPARYTTTFDHDDLGRRTYTAEPDGAVTLQTFTATGEPLTLTDPAGKVTAYASDVAGRTTKVTDPLGRATESVYDLAGRATEARRLAPSGAVVSAVSNAYDAAGNRTATTSARGFTTTWAYDAVGRLTTATQPVDATTSIVATYGYDAVGNPTRLTDGRGNSTWSTYTAWNQQEDLLEPATDAHPGEADRRWRTRYDAAGSPIEQRQPGGIVVARDFDRLGRLVAESGSGPGVPGASRSFGYDLAGRRTSASHPGGEVTFAYDDRSLLTAAVAPTGDSSFDYDAAGRLASRTDAAGTARFTWTARDELDTATDPLTGITRDYTWDDAGQLTSVAHSPGGAVRTYGYDDAGRLVDDALRTADGTLSMQEAYVYDADDNVVSQTTTLPGNAAATTNTFGYDRAGRVTSWARPGLPTVDYGWDAANNRTSAGASTWTYDQRNRMVTGSDGTYAWTPRGTLASATAAGEETSYVFDALGRLVDYDGEAAYSYDALDRVAARNATSFAYAGTEMDPVSDGLATYARTPGGDLLAVQDAAGAHVVGRNRHGDVTHLVAGDGTVAGSRLYDPFGAPLATAGVALPAAGFQGDWTDPASGKVWMGARWYDGEDAAFASRDSVRGDLNSPISLNRYTYAFGDPLSYFDPDGHWPSWLGGKRHKPIARATESISGATMSMIAKTASAMRSQTIDANSAKTSKVRTLPGTDVPLPANWATMPSRQRMAFVAKNDPSIRNMKLTSNSIGSIASDMGKSAVNFGTGFVDGTTSAVTLGHAGTKIGPVYKDKHLTVAYGIGVVTGQIETALAGGAAGGALKGAVASRVGAARTAVSAIRTSRASSAAAGAVFNGAVSSISAGADAKSIALATVLGAAGGALAGGMARGAGRAPGAMPKGSTSVATGSGAASGSASVVRPVSRSESMGEVFNELKARTWVTDQEHALVRMRGGECAIVCGGQQGIHGMEIEELIAHTHPYSLPAQGASVADYTALNQLGQQSSVLLEQGSEIVFSQSDPMYIKLFGGS